MVADVLRVSRQDICNDMQQNYDVQPIPVGMFFIGDVLNKTTWNIVALMTKGGI